MKRTCSTKPIEPTVTFTITSLYSLSTDLVCQLMLTMCSAIFFLPNQKIYLTAEIVMFEGLTCVYRSSVDLFFYVVGSSNENEVMECTRKYLIWIQ